MATSSGVKVCTFALTPCGSLGQCKLDGLTQILFSHQALPMVGNDSVAVDDYNLREFVDPIDFERTVRLDRNGRKCALTLRSPTHHGFGAVFGDAQDLNFVVTMESRFQRSREAISSEHGPHHVAQKSSTTTLPFSLESWNGWPVSVWPLISGAAWPMSSVRCSLKGMCFATSTANDESGWF